MYLALGTKAAQTSHNTHLQPYQTDYLCTWKERWKQAVYWKSYIIAIPDRELSKSLQFLLISSNATIWSMVPFSYVLRFLQRCINHAPV